MGEGIFRHLTLSLSPVEAERGSFTPLPIHDGKLTAKNAKNTEKKEFTGSPLCDLCVLCG
jgi:hypothetical protein